MTDTAKPRLMGVNHIALDVGDVDEALDFYGAIFDFELRGEHRDEKGTRIMAFIDLGDQFIALSQGRDQGPDIHRHFGLVVDDRSRVRDLAQQAGAELPRGRTLRFRDPWGNQVEVVEYRDLQFLKHDSVLQSMGLRPDKTDEAHKELAQKGIHI